MTDKKLTDSEIVKVLECFVNEECPDCESCSYYDYCQKRRVYIDAFDLINRLQAENDTLCQRLKDMKKALFEQQAYTSKLQAENERKDKIYIELLKTSSERAGIIGELQAENERLKKENHWFADIGKLYSEIKAEAYKECIEKAKSEIDSQSHSRSLEASGERFRIKQVLDNLLKELVGEGGGNK